MNFVISACTDAGPVKPVNQDSYCVRTMGTPHGDMVFAAVCDGMGGLARGEVASATVIDVFRAWCDEQLPYLADGVITAADIEGAWNSLVLDCARRIRDWGNERQITLGTTLAALLVTQQARFLMHVGDTRAYCLTAAGVTQETLDHSLVQREVDAGLLTAEAARTDSRRNVLLQCIGASEVVRPDFSAKAVSPGEVYLLCSDGFYHEVSEAELWQGLQPDRMLDEEGMRQNLAALIGTDRQRGEKDNITAVAVRTW